MSNRRACSLVTLLITIAGVVALRAPARAEIESTVVKKGLAAYSELEYAQAVTLLTEAQQESLTREEKIVVYRTLALAHIALGDFAAGKNAFIGLLRTDPTSQIDRAAAPKVRALFEEAKAQAATSGRLDDSLPSVKATLDPPKPIEGQPVRVTVRYPGGVAKTMSLYHRAGAARAFEMRSVPATDDGTFSATIPAAGVRAPALQIHVALLDAAGAGVAAAGSVALPLEIAIGARTKPLYKRGWFWASSLGSRGRRRFAGPWARCCPTRARTSEVRPL